MRYKGHFIYFYQIFNFTFPKSYNWCSHRPIQKEARTTIIINLVETQEQQEEKRNNNIYTPYLARMSEKLRRIFFSRYFFLVLNSNFYSLLPCFNVLSREWLKWVFLHNAHTCIIRWRIWGMSGVLNRAFLEKCRVLISAVKWLFVLWNCILESI